MAIVVFPGILATFHDLAASVYRQMMAEFDI